jgi:redox-sensitive bicupin YhaK (pirin superfamily)
MNLTVLKKSQRGFMDGHDFKGYPLFSNGARGTIRPNNFGALYVFNDDYLLPNAYVGLHPHANTEIVTIQLEGAQNHKDNFGYEQRLDAGAVQLISSGLGIQHAGGNVSEQTPARHLQIWIAPAVGDTKPTIQLKPPTVPIRQNQWESLVSPDGSDDSLRIQQNAWILRGRFEEGPIAYGLHKSGNGVMIYVLEGKILVDQTTADQEDTLFITDAETVNLLVKEPVSLVLIETVL